MKAQFYTRLDNTIICHLCPHECSISEGNAGICKVRSNQGGELVAETYGLLSAIHFDPIEKKPLYHYFPGKEILSLGSLGCNFRCSCCQNYNISQAEVKGFPRTVKMDIPEIISTSTENPQSIGIAYTYNEPSVWFEYMFDIATAARSAKLKNVMVSNGYINIGPLNDLIQVIDAFNIDLKAFDEKVHRKFTGGDLKKVLKTLKFLADNGKHFEITCLVIPGINDDISAFEKMIDWMVANLGEYVPLHLSRYFPEYKLSNETTPRSLLDKLGAIAKKKLKFVYIGNIPTEYFQNTICPKCGHEVISRRGYYIQSKHLSIHGNCKYCDFEIAEV